MDSRVPSFPPSLQGKQQPLQQVTESTPCTGNGTRDELGNISSRSPRPCSPPSPPGTFAGNFSMRSELDKINITDHCYNTQDADDDDLNPDNINMASLMSKIRQIRSSGQIQYRVPKQRKRKAPKSGDEMEMDEAELSDEIVTVYRQKRVKKAPVRARSAPYDKRNRKSSKEGQQTHSKPAHLPKSTEIPELPETTSETPSVSGGNFEAQP